MTVKFSLGIMDYLMVSLLLLVSIITGIVFRFTGNHQKTTDEYLMGEKSSPIFPVVMSISVSLTSSILIIGAPAEVYRFGSQYAIIGFGVVIGMLISSYLFMPVYFQCNVTSIYEFLEMRFGKFTRYTVSSLFVLQMVLYVSAILYGPVLALSAVTNLHEEAIIVICGLACTCYCFLGGLKAILWTDAFQGFLMFTCIIIMYITGITEVGGISEVIRRAEEGDRIKFFDTQFNLTTRYTFWNVFLRGLSLGVGIYGTNQLEVQRALSMSRIERAQLAFRWSLLPVLSLFVSCISFGIILYAVFYLCDPLKDVDIGLTKYDQLVPYFIVSRLHEIPGLTGLCFAGVFSGSLSSVSSALNSLTTVTVVDFLKPVFLTRLTDSKAVFIAKGLSLFYGTLCVFLTFAIAKGDSTVQMTLTFLSVVEGPVLAIFLIGVLTRKASDKVTMFTNIIWCAMFGLITGFAVSCWAGFGGLFSGHRSTELPFETIGCSNSSNITNFLKNASIDCFEIGKCSILKEEYSPSQTFALYKMSFLWIPTFACIFTASLMLLWVLFTGWQNNVIPSDSKCLCPIVRNLMSKSANQVNGKKEVELEEKLYFHNNG